MTVCLECGLNTAIFTDHAPGCSQHEARYKTNPEEFDSVDEGVSAQWSAVIDVAAERGTLMSKSILKDALHKSLDIDDIDSLDDLEEIFFDKKTMDIINLCAWAGVMSGIQVLSEQDFIDTEAVARYLHMDEDGTI